MPPRSRPLIIAAALGAFLAAPPGFRADGGAAPPGPRAAAPAAAPRADAGAQPAPRPDYRGAFAQELARVGALPPEDLARRGAGAYLPQIGWDPTEARFFDLFARDPSAQLSHLTGEGGPADFRLHPEELRLLRRNGFVVSERLGGPSFGDLFYRIFHSDLPIFVSADAVLHAWHRSYDGMLLELEERVLAPAAADVLDAMAAALPAAQRDHAAGPLGASVGDAEVILTVARSLLRGARQGSGSGRDGEVGAVLRAIEAQAPGALRLFGAERAFDYSLLKVRGHYARSEVLGRYFRALSWLGLLELRLREGPVASLREPGAALVLQELLQRAGRGEAWQRIDELLVGFAGRRDALGPGELAARLRELRAPELKTLRRPALRELIGRLAQAAGAPQLAGQDGRTGPAFSLLGQRFSLDSWALAQVTYDRALQDGVAVRRALPSALDVAFAALGNDRPAAELARRMLRRDGVVGRDGLPYQQSLLAARRVIDQLPEAVWDESLYTGWLRALRALSAPTTGAAFPEALRTGAWADRVLNAQLASWTELRHDTILYTKQSRAHVLCEYAAGYVEPVPALFQQLGRAAELGRRLLERSAPDKSAAMRAFLDRFAGTMETLRQIAERELQHQPLTPEQERFLKHVVQIDRGCGGPPTYSGWYPGLFYPERADCAIADALVADVHTATSEGGGTQVLHEAVGGVDLLVLGVDSGKDRMVFAGPVLSHYELITPGTERLSDGEWAQRLREGPRPPRPEWTASYLVLAPARPPAAPVQDAAPRPPTAPKARPAASAPVTASAPAVASAPPTVTTAPPIAASAPPPELPTPAMLAALQSLWWAGDSFQPRDGGALPFSDRLYVPIPAGSEVTALTFHPDGRPVIAEGSLVSRVMRVSTLDRLGRSEPLVQIQLIADTGKIDVVAEQRRGRLWSFAGPLVIAPRGDCVFSLGPVMPNGLFLVASRQPPRIEQLRETQPIGSLQVPGTDPAHLYVTMTDGVDRLALADLAGPAQPWLRLDGVHLHRALVLDADRLLVVVSWRRPLSDGNERWYPLLLDRRRRSVQPLRGPSLGAMAVSPDGRTVLHARDGALRELRLGP